MKPNGELQLPAVACSSGRGAASPTANLELQNFKPPNFPKAFPAGFTICRKNLNPIHPLCSRCQPSIPLSKQPTQISAAAAAVTGVLRREVQAHGFSWEKNLLALYGATADEIKAIPYCSKIDLPAAYNRINGCDVSIKTTCSKNAVCMGDCLRVYDAIAAGTPLHLTTVFYKQDDTAKTKILTEVVEVDLTNSLSVLFGTLTREQLEALDQRVKAVPQKRKPTPEEYTSMYTLRNELQSFSGAVHLDIKCNSQQSRLQCSFNRFQAFLEANPIRIVARSTTPTLHGKEVLATVASGRRVFTR